MKSNGITQWSIGNGQLVKCNRYAIRKYNLYSAILPLIGYNFGLLI